MFNIEFIRSLKSLGIFLLLYTILFVVFFWTLPYIFPFVAAFFIAFLIQPVTKFFKERLKLTKSGPSILSSILVYLVFFLIISLLIYKIISEAATLLSNLPNLNMDIIINPISKLISEISVYFNDIQPDFIEKNISQITRIFTNGANLLGKGLSAFLSIAASVPMWITVLFIIIMSTYFFSRDMVSIKVNIMNVFSEKGKEKFSKVWYEGIKMLSQYAKAYLLIYSLTFVQTLIGFSILGIKYAVILSLICAIADILPILGIAVIYLPLAFIYLMSGNYFAAIGLIILFLIISAVRQIIEPKIVSSSLGIHPVMILATIFIGLKAYGFIGMIYLTFLVVLYKILKVSKILA